MDFPDAIVAIKKENEVLGLEDITCIFDNWEQTNKCQPVAPLYIECTCDYTSFYSDSVHLKVVTTDGIEKEIDVSLYAGCLSETAYVEGVLDTDNQTLDFAQIQYVDQCANANSKDK